MAPGRAGAAGLALVLTLAACGGAGSGGAYGARPAAATALPSASAAPAQPSPYGAAAASPAGGYGYDYGYGSGGASPGAGAEGALGIATNAKLGKILVAAGGMTLYVWDGDQPDKSNCTAGCASTWPPFTVSAEPQPAAGQRGKLGLITRADGKKQVTYNGSPLYFYVGDRKPGDTTGDGVGGTWHAVTDP